MPKSLDQVYEYRRDGFVISTDRGRVDLGVVHGFLTGSYWAGGISREAVARMIRNADCFGIYREEGEQVGFARVLTDYVRFAYVMDVFVVEEYRGRGLSKWLMEVVVGHPPFGEVRRWMLGTRDAHGLYEKVGFRALGHPEVWMERVQMVPPGEGAGKGATGSRE